MLTLIGILIMLYIIGHLSLPKQRREQAPFRQSDGIITPSSKLIQSYIRSDERDTEYDPVCGCYIDKERAVTRVLLGEKYFYCSEVCASEHKVKFTA